MNPAPDSTPIHHSLPAAFSCQELRFSYRDKLVLHLPEWRVAMGSRIFLRGASGSGKSTLLNLLCGMLTPSSGKLFVLERDLAQMSGHARDRFRARHMGVVFQQFNLVPWLSVRDNIYLAAHFAGAEKAATELRLKQLAEQLRLANNLLSRNASELSVGQQQRVAVMRALINHPEILLVDEPTSALDQDNRDAFISLLLSTLDSYGATLLFVSHDQTLAHHFAQQLTMSDFNRVERTTENLL